MQGKPRRTTIAERINSLRSLGGSFSRNNRAKVTNELSHSFSSPLFFTKARKSKREKRKEPKPSLNGEMLPRNENLKNRIARPYSELYENNEVKFAAELARTNSDHHGNRFQTSGSPAMALNNHSVVSNVDDTESSHSNGPFADQETSPGLLVHANTGRFCVSISPSSNLRASPHVDTSSSTRCSENVTSESVSYDVMKCGPDVDGTVRKAEVCSVKDAEELEKRILFASDVKENVCVIPTNVLCSETLAASSPAFGEHLSSDIRDAYQVSENVDIMPIINNESDGCADVAETSFDNHDKHDKVVDSDSRANDTDGKIGVSFANHDQIHRDRTLGSLPTTRATKRAVAATGRFSVIDVAPSIESSGDVSSNIVVGERPDTGQDDASEHVGIVPIINNNGGCTEGANVSFANHDKVMHSETKANDTDGKIERDRTLSSLTPTRTTKQAVAVTGRFSVIDVAPSIESCGDVSSNIVVDERPDTGQDEASEHVGIEPIINNENCGCAEGASVSFAIHDKVMHSDSRANDTDGKIEVSFANHDQIHRDRTLSFLPTTRTTKQAVAVTGRFSVIDVTPSIDLSGDVSSNIVVDERPDTGQDEASEHVGIVPIINNENGGCAEGASVSFAIHDKVMHSDARANDTDGKIEVSFANHDQIHRARCIPTSTPTNHTNQLAVATTGRFSVAAVSPSTESSGDLSASIFMGEKPGTGSVEENCEQLLKNRSKAAEELETSDVNNRSTNSDTLYAGRFSIRKTNPFLRACVSDGAEDVRKTISNVNKTRRTHLWPRQEKTNSNTVQAGRFAVRRSVNTKKSMQGIDSSLNGHQRSKSDQPVNPIRTPASVNRCVSLVEPTETNTKPIKCKDMVDTDDSTVVNADWGPYNALDACDGVRVGVDDGTSANDSYNTVREGRFLVRQPSATAEPYM
eukprot:CFRG3545T1